MNVVAIVGRPNVGKSTLFNRLIGEKNAIVESEPGVTRDRLYGISDWNGKYFHVIDTGGFIPGTEDKMEKAIREQAMIAIDEADAIVFVCDGRDGITPFDQDISTILRTSKKPVTLVVNKCDNNRQDLDALEFHALGLGEPFPVSGLSGHGTGDFLDHVTDSLTEYDHDEDDERLKIAFVGRPNVGKSSLTNALLGEDRMIVTDIPGTTRDATDSVVKYYGDEVVLIDTAGLRRKTRIKENVEMFSTLRTARAIERCDVAVIMVDATLGMEDQDKRILNQAAEARKGLLIAVNKWDLVEKDTKTADQYTEIIHESIKTFDYVPIIYVSAKTKQRATNIIKLAQGINERRKKRIKTSELNKTLMADFDRTPPPSAHGLDMRINYVTQVGTEPPVFAFFLNHPKLLKDSYKRFMERTLRKHFDFSGTPISFVFRKKNLSRDEYLDHINKKK